MGGGFHGGFGRTKGRAAAGDASFMRGDDLFFRNIRHRDDIDTDGVFDVVAHGSARSIWVEHRGEGVAVSSRTAARIIAGLPDYKKGQPIRLLSCNTGAKNDGFAQNLANKLNVVVYAPNNLLWSFSNGSHIVAACSKFNPRVPDLEARGRFIKYVPGGNRR